MSVRLLGQDKIVAQIDAISIDSWPSTVCVLGDYGCGKHLLTDYIAEKFNLPKLDITKDLTQDIVNAISINNTPTLYCINADKITVKQQNMILKLIEEPLPGVFIVLLCESAAHLLETVLNRCYKIVFEQYSKELLASFINEGLDKEYILSLSNTPGQVLEIQQYDVLQVKELSDKVFEKMSVASLPNALSIADKLAFKKEKDKIDPHIFIRALLSSIFNKVKNDSNVLFYKMYELTNTLYYKSKSPNIDLQYLFDSFILQLWRVSRGKC